MDRQVHTLYDLIQGHEQAFACVVYKAVETSLVNLGESVRDLDWASVAIATKKDRAEAA